MVVPNMLLYSQLFHSSLSFVFQYGVQVIVLITGFIMLSVHFKFGGESGGKQALTPTVVFATLGLLFEESETLTNVVALPQRSHSVVQLV